MCDSCNEQNNIPPFEVECPVYLTTNCVTYKGEDLPNSGIVDGDTTTVALEKIDAALGGAGEKYYRAVVYFGPSSSGLFVKVLKNTLIGDVTWTNMFGDRMIGTLTDGFGVQDPDGVMRADMYVQKIHNDDLTGYRGFISDPSSCVVYYDAASADFRMYVNITVYE